MHYCRQFTVVLSSALILALGSLYAQADEAKLTVRSPLDYQVFQRSSRESGSILLSGHSHAEADAVEWRLEGESEFGELPSQWQRLPLNIARQFNAEVGLPAGGWYRLQLRLVAGDDVLAEQTIPHVGVGEVLVGAGQSNSTNSGQFKTKQTSGMVASFSGEAWRLADDPQSGVADRSQGGSFWPALGDALYEKYRVPIGVAATGFGGTSVNQWQPGGDLFEDWMLRRVRELGKLGFRALLWHQGESDVQMATDEYYEKLRTTIVASRREAGWDFPWLVAQASYHNPEKPKFDNIRDAQARLWRDGVALPGPDTDQLGGDNRDFDGKGIHFSPKGLKKHGQMWAEKLAPLIDEAIGDDAR